MTNQSCRTDGRQNGRPLTETSNLSESRREGADPGFKYHGLTTVVCISQVAPFIPATSDSFTHSNASSHSNRHASEGKDCGETIYMTSPKY